MWLQESELRNITIAICALGVLAACGEEPAPRSVAEFMEDRILLDATMVRCVQDRAASRYEAECVNAREAVERIAAAEDKARREELEAQSARKRQAVRRAQEAAAEARQRALEEERRREEAAYFGEFEPLPDAVQEVPGTTGATAGEAPGSTATEPPPED